VVTKGAPGSRLQILRQIGTGRKPLAGLIREACYGATFGESEGTHVYQMRNTTLSMAFNPKAIHSIAANLSAIRMHNHNSSMPRINHILHIPAQKSFSLLLVLYWVEPQSEPVLVNAVLYTPAASINHLIRYISRHVFSTILSIRYTV
jgi:hypothetical protein